MKGSNGALLYLAHLFLGQCLEDTGDLPGRPSTKMPPRFPCGRTPRSARAALAHAYSLRGGAEKGREILDRSLSLSGTRRTVDPYWNYLMGAPDLAETLIEDLRAETIR